MAGPEPQWPTAPAASAEDKHSEFALRTAEPEEFALREAEPEMAGPSIADRVRAVCPYLLAEDGASRRLGPWRGHRCMAVHPPARLALDKQRRLCLVTDHLTCPAYLAARGSDGSVAGMGLAGPDLERVTRWSITRTTSSIVEPGSRLDGLTNRISGTVAQAILGGALLVALLAMVRGQFVPGASPSASASPDASAGVSPSASATPLASPTPAPTDVAVVTPVAPTPSPATPQPSASAIYTVKAGDTLYDLAIAYHTTVKAIMELNGLSTTDLVIGQMLLIP
jgi:LysM repeat protein